MMKFKYTFLSLIVILLLASCGVQYDYTKVKSTSLTPDVVRLNMNLENFEPLGETEISVNFRTYLGFITCLDSINNIAYERRVVNKVVLKGHKDFNLHRYLDRATNKVIREFPEADYYVPMYTSRQVLKMFLGRSTRETMVIKAYKLK